MHKPLAVQAAAGFFQQSNAALVDGDESIVVRQNINDPTLFINVGTNTSKSGKFVNGIRSTVAPVNVFASICANVERRSSRTESDGRSSRCLGESMPCVSPMYSAIHLE